MRQALWTGVIGLTGLTVASCGGPSGRLASLQPPELIALLQTGRPVLDCRQDCLSEWKRVQPKAMQLDASGNWRELAILVMQTGYQDDLSLYYLGRAAEGMGWDAAAGSYYRQSMQLSGTAIGCKYLSKLCGGVLLPSEALQRLTAILDRPAPTVPRRPRTPAPPTPTPRASEPAPAPAAPTIPASEPSPPPPPTPSEAKPAPRNPNAAGTLEYIEPPPAR